MADGNSGIGFARLCYIAGVQVRAAQKSYKLSSGVRTWPVECSKLGKTRIIADANIRLVRNAAFLNRIFICIPSEIERCNLFIYYLSLKGTLCADCNSSFLTLAAGGTDRLNRHGAASYHFNSLEF